MQLSTKVKPCKHCQKKTHFSWQCLNDPNKPKYNLGKKSKHRSRWAKVRRQWFRDNHAESFSCHYCGVFLWPNQTTLDHKKSRSRHPELRYELDNLVPACWRCNSDKSSKDADEYLKQLTNKEAI